MTRRIFRLVCQRSALLGSRLATLVSLTALAATLVIFSHSREVVAAPAPGVFDVPPPLGMQEYRETGEYPLEVCLDERSGAVMLWHWQNAWTADGSPLTKEELKRLDLHNRIPSYQFTNLGPPGKSSPGLVVRAGQYEATDVGSPGATTINLDRATNRVVPVFGHLYLVTAPGGGGIRLRRVTDDAPEALLPQPKSRTISLAEEEIVLFGERSPDHRDEMFFDVVKDLKIEAETANFTLSPSGNRRSAKERSKRNPLDVKVRKGDLLTARGQSYRVLNVVAPQKVNGFDLAGWLEIANDPPAAVPASDRTLKK